MQELYLVLNKDCLKNLQKVDLIFLKDLLPRILNYYNKILYKFLDQNKLFLIFKENGYKS